MQKKDVVQIFIDKKILIIVVLVLLFSLWLWFDAQNNLIVAAELRTRACDNIGGWMNG